MSSNSVTNQKEAQSAYHACESVNLSVHIDKSREIREVDSLNKLLLMLKAV